MLTYSTYQEVSPEGELHVLTFLGDPYYFKAPYLQKRKLRHKDIK